MEPQGLSPIQKELEAIFKKDPFSLVSVIDFLKRNTGEGLPADPEVEASTWEIWSLALNSLLKSGFHNQAKEVAIAWYHRLNELQNSNKKRYHKGSSAHNLSNCFIRAGDVSCGAWFEICAFVEDAISLGGQFPERPAKQSLEVYFNYSRHDLDVIVEAVKEVLSEDEWLRRYPEVVIIRLAREGKLKIPLFTNALGIPVNRGFLGDAINKLPEGSNDDKKKSLEFLASYLLITLPGVRIRANVKAFEHGVTFEHEIDLVATQYSSAPTYLLEALGRHFLVECKNWTAPMGVRDLNHFVAKMRFHRCKCGVVFSENGLSGSKELDGLKHARVTQLRWYQQDDCVVIIVTQQHLQHLLKETSSNFMDLLLSLYETVRFNSFDEMA